MTEAQIDTLLREVAVVQHRCDECAEFDLCAMGGPGRVACALFEEAM
jgi:hypothetical protein